MVETGIRCPDCLVTYIDTNTYEKYGMCITCRRRLIQSKNKGKEYIKYKDLPEEEKIRLEHIRERNKEYIAQKSDKVKTKVVEKVKSGKGVRIITEEIGNLINIIASDSLTIKKLQK